MDKPWITGSRLVSLTTGSQLVRLTTVPVYGLFLVLYKGNYCKPYST